ncbi:hypothetical protein K450DRAFT_255277 [Umbelopsis ramanniana AG]|uniref:Uncharacterized protein n=1 Tax=Umbelopsis ramanniana AG TaxID=1314678 RepID=A0AAD5HBP9_UMBRA|nr:uncharacterized protein K450DRAFT_255277 [Umbelopsis ramanniana AG]KAI8576721.1 hypothetical protein K450DRAFT_255277 [Umbelopsis ramanniana AG]
MCTLTTSQENWPELIPILSYLPSFCSLMTLLQPSSPSIATRMLAIIQTWSIHNGIKVNVNKSAVIDSPFSRPLLLPSIIPPPSHLYLLMNTSVFHLPPTVLTFPALSLLSLPEQENFSSHPPSTAKNGLTTSDLLSSNLLSIHPQYVLPLLHASDTLFPRFFHLQTLLTQWVCQGHRGYAAPSRNLAG